MEALTKEQAVRTLRLQLLNIEHLLSDDNKGWSIVDGLATPLKLDSKEAEHVWTEMHDVKACAVLYK